MQPATTALATMPDLDTPVAPTQAGRAALDAARAPDF